ncbi:MAG: hypothetical protein ACRDVZ_10310 [Jiangellaceae bacterium]
MTRVDTLALEAKVRDMYRRVAEQPQGGYHFEMGLRLRSPQVGDGDAL